MHLGCHDTGMLLYCSTESTYGIDTVVRHEHQNTEEQHGTNNHTSATVEKSNLLISAAIDC